MAVLLALHTRLIREYARRYLGSDASDDAVETAIERTARRLLSRDVPSSPHGLRLTMTVLAAECRREREQKTRPEMHRREPPADRFLGRLDGPLGRVLDRLSPRQRKTLTLAAQGLTVAEIARLDNTPEGAVRVRLHRARERAAKLLHETGGNGSALVLLGWSRVRGAIHRWMPQRVAETMTGPMATAGALIPLLAAVVLGPSLQALEAQPAQAAQPQTHIVTSTPSAPGAHPPPSADPGGAGARPSRDPTSASQPPLPPSLTLAVRSLTAITPTDIRLTAVATLPGVQSPVIVAVGTGLGCACPVLVQSLDGGVTWTATDGADAPPPDVNQLALPPGYPTRDSRIFAGVDPHGGGSPYTTAAFGQPFQHITSLPAGQVAVSAHLDDGDPRVFSAALTGVWSVDPRSPAPAPHEEVDYSSGGALQNVVAALATPAAPSSSSPSLLAWVPGWALATGPTVASSSSPALMVCAAGGGCTVAGTLPLPPGGLVTTAAAVIAYRGTQAYVSHDLGRTLQPLEIPRNAAEINSAALVGSALTPWISGSRADGTAFVLRLDASREWQDAAAGEPSVLSHFGDLIALDRDRVLDALTGAGYRCTVAVNPHWMPRCP